jgi:hypothetical protein
MLKAGNPLAKGALVLLRILRLAALLFCVLCGSSPALAAGRGRVEVVRFPDDWTWFDRGGHEYLPAPIIYKVWRLPGAGGDELLFGAARRGDEGHVTGAYVGQEPRQEWSGAVPGALGKDYSEDFFAVSPGGGRPRVRRVSEPERQRGEPVLNGYHYLSSYKQKIDLLDEKDTPPGVRHAGRLFAKSGRNWGSTVGVLSPGGRWLAVLSYTSPEKRRKFRSVLEEGGEPQRGVLHVDVYDAATGERVLAGEHPYRLTDASTLFGNSVWVEERYFVMPLAFDLRRCMLLTLPADQGAAGGSA